MKKILSLIFLSLFITTKGFPDNEMPEKARPNDKRISLYEYKKKLWIQNLRGPGHLYTIKPKRQCQSF